MINTLPPGEHQSIFVRIVKLCTRFSRLVVVAAITIATLAAWYGAETFRVDSNINNLLSSKLPWHEREVAYQALFPRINETTLVVINGRTPEQASSAARALADALRSKSDFFRSVQIAQGGSFFAQNELLYLSPDELSGTTGRLESAGPLIRTLAADPSLRGLVQALSLGLAGAREGGTTLDGMAPVLTRASNTLESVATGRPASFSWKEALQQDSAATSRERQQILTVWTVLDHGALQPGARATAEIRKVVNDVKLESNYNVTTSITGPVPISDEQLSTLQHGAALNGAITGLIVLTILWLALRSVRLVLAVVITLAVGLTLTTALGLLIVGAFNPISTAFAVLFVGLGADFAIQFSVRYRAQRYRSGTLEGGLYQAAERVGAPLTLAAGAAAAGFLSFMPTSYAGLAQLGIIAACGMVVAYVGSFTLLPALIYILRPPQEPQPLRQAWLAPVDHVLRRHRFAIVAITALIALAGLPALMKLKFDFNPLDLDRRNTPAVAELLRLDRDPIFSANTAEVVVNSDHDATAVAKKLSELPEVAKTRTVASLVPEGQDQKLAIIRATSERLSNDINPIRRPPPSDTENVAALNQGAKDLNDVAEGQNGTGANAARRLAGDLTKLAEESVEQRAAATAAFIRPLHEDLENLRQMLKPERVTRASLPQYLVSGWVAADGRQRVEALPKGNPEDEATIVKFARAVLGAEPAATGQAVETLDWGDTMLHAFEQAAAFSLIAIAVLLFIVLRRVTDVLITLIPLITAALVTLEICATANFPLNYANIIALPVLLGVGVAFKIYYVMAWRHGQTEFLQSALTHAVFFSALLTATAFGSLWLSSNPGISSMGALLALSLICTLSAATLFQPALMGTPPKQTQKDKGITSHQQ